ncbi:MAG: DUF5665 domain-containing protein [Bacillota bacterium]
MSPAGRVLARLDELVAAMEKANVAEFIELYRHPLKLLWMNFAAGAFRGFGIAVGFTVVGAVFLFVLGRLAMLNLPFIGSFIAEIVRIVQTQLSAP